MTTPSRATREARAVAGAPNAPRARFGRPRVASGAQKSFEVASDVAKCG
jgi:hypothetical protein